MRFARALGLHRLPDSTQDRLRRLRLRVLAGLGKEVFVRPNDARPVTHLGGTRGRGYGSWAVWSDDLRSDSVVYSLGVGDDISFDLDLIARFGLEVHAFDPTPEAARWLGSQTLPDGFLFHNVGVAGHDGTALFFPNRSAGIASSVVQGSHVTETPTELAVRRLPTLMADLGHTYLDLLKMDIEGAEYSVIEDVLSADVEIRQILVEFHHRFDAIPRDATRDALARLCKASYRIFYVSPNGEEYSLVHARN
jgi:FkbM family methyltransferase